jgi:antitoxin CptB
LNAERKAKINWHCRRGMLELDLILERFAKRHLDTLNDNQLTAFETLLECNDPDIYAWLMGYEQPQEPIIIDIITYIKLHDKVLVI